MTIIRTAAPPTAIPAMAPVDKPLFFAGSGVWVGVATATVVGVDVGVEVDSEWVVGEALLTELLLDGPPSSGKSSPGCSM
jgi:hypothetical protein